MGATTRATTLASVAAVLLGACSTDATARLPADQGAGTNVPIATAIGPPAPIAAPSFSAPLPDAQGNPACPVADSWGKAPIDDGIFITYWANQTDYVTALVHTSFGLDFAQSAGIDPAHQPLIFDFPNIDPSTVREVLITTNIERCFATPDPATSGR
jgi:hypothetical protein